MSKQGSSPQLLTDQYTDSEGEENPNDRKRKFSSLTSSTDTAVWKEPIIGEALITSSPSESIKSGANTPQLGTSFNADDSQRVAPRLVSYNIDEATSDDNDSDGNEEDSNSQVEFPVARVSERTDAEQLMPGEELLPPEPIGKCLPEVQEKITRLHESILQKGLDLNSSIQQRKQFRNPSIYKKLITYLGVKERGTNYPPELYDPVMWEEESRSENLSKLLMNEKKRRDKIEVQFASGMAAKRTEIAPSVGNIQDNSAEKDRNKRRSKWDQAVPASASIPAGQSSVQFTSVPTDDKTATSAFDVSNP